ncbi:MAG: YidC/Oxa1 family membrane protein insertase, partial [Lachnospiraceae bacterium]|nr:YidC/Oxa1 family membrane protein insertase [Candidatus Minthocola equi]
NLLVLPLYMLADAMQEEERDTESRFNKWVTHIKKTFKGDERTMMLQMYYKQNNYSPVQILRSAASLLLEIPFFIAAYSFLSNLELLQGASFGPISDLSQPDGLLQIGTLSINILPIIMTIINVISSAIFSKNYPLKTKIQLYAMAAFFLVFLYSSPAGLAFYWTLNNLFSLIKTLLYKIKHSKLVIAIISAWAGIALILLVAIPVFLSGLRRNGIFIGMCGLLLFLPIITFVLKANGKRFNISNNLPAKEPSTKRFVLTTIFLSVLTGLLIPSAVISASPQEFLDVNYFVHPLWYLVHSFLLASGLFVLWFGVFYWLSSKKAKPIFEYIMFALCGISIVDYLFFGTGFGNMSSDLIFDGILYYSMTQIAINGLILLVVAVLFAVIFNKLHRFIPGAVAVATVAFICMVTINCVKINDSVSKVEIPTEAQEQPTFTLSKSGKNVVFIMLDRALGEYIPYIMNEKPELKEQFAGFTYYSDVVSFGGTTNFGSPALFGGYEYTPVEINKRNTELLKDKQNEALQVMPALFDSIGYGVTIFDPTYAGYSWTPDLSIFDKYENFRTFNVDGYFLGESVKVNQVLHRNRNFFCYSLTKIAPAFAQEFLYDKGQYNQILRADEDTSGQVAINQSIATGTNVSFMEAYSTLQNMTSMTTLNDNPQGSFLMMTNDTTHENQLLVEPSYTPQNSIDNTKYDEENVSRFIVDGKELMMYNEYQMSHYHVNMAALLQLGNWFDDLREMGVYDNTRIIISADHGRGMWHLASLITDTGMDIGSYYPLLMVKDFNSTEFTTSEEFMTNADVPVIAIDGLIDNPINPMTGKALTNEAKYAPELYIFDSGLWEIDTNNGTTFLPGPWYSMSESIWKKENWKLVAEDAIFPY